jgi:hypothetical protein
MQQRYRAAHVLPRKRGRDNPFVSSSRSDYGVHTSRLAEASGRDSLSIVDSREASHVDGCCGAWTVW